MCGIYHIFSGVSILRGFGFVQFDRLDDAKKAVEMEAGGLLKGQRIGIYIMLWTKALCYLDTSLDIIALFRINGP